MPITSSLFSLLAPLSSRSLSGPTDPSPDKFIDFLKTGGLYEPWIADCPLHYTSPNAPEKRDVLGTVLLSVLAGHHRYSHITNVRCDNVNPGLLGMTAIVSEDSVRKALRQIDETPGAHWLKEHMRRCYDPLLCVPWIMDGDTTVKPLYGKQEGAVIGYNLTNPADRLIRTTAT